jgi:hypothetical protein
LSVEVTDRDDLEVLAAAVTAFFSDALVTPYFRQADNTGASEYFQRRRFNPTQSSETRDDYIPRVPRICP